MSSDSKKVLEKEIKTREIELKKLEIEIGVFKEALRIISIPASPVVVHSSTRSDSSKEAYVKSGSVVEKAKNILDDSDRPLHVNEILEKIWDIKEIDKSKKISLTSTLNKYSNKGHLFKKTGSNMFWAIDKEGK